jgi:inhibitor of cysteine peptidase
MVVSTSAGTGESLSPLARVQPIVRAFVLLLFAAFVFAGAAAAHSPRVIGIGQKQNGENAEVHVGDTLVVSLPANPRSGYSWRLAAVNRRLLRPDARGYVPAAHPPLAQAATGVAVIIFKAVARGTTTLNMNYAGGASGKTIANRYTVLITVSPRDH